MAKGCSCCATEVGMLPAAQLTGCKRQQMWNSCRLTANLTVWQFSILIEENIFLLILSLVVPANSSASLPVPK